MNRLIDASARVLLLWVVVGCATFFTAFRYKVSLDMHHSNILAQQPIFEWMAMALNHHSRSVVAAQNLLLLSGLIVVAVAFLVHAAARRTTRWVDLLLIPIALFAVPLVAFVWRTILNLLHGDAYADLFPLARNGDEVSYFMKSFGLSDLYFDVVASAAAQDHWWVTPYAAVVRAMPYVLQGLAMAAAVMLVAGLVLPMLKGKTDGLGASVQS